MNRIREIREQRGLSQTALAKRVEITQNAVSQYENNARDPNGKILIRLAAVLGVSEPYLLGMTDSPEREDRLPPDWVQTVERAISKGLSPEDVEKAIQMLLFALDKSPNPRGQHFPEE